MADSLGMQSSQNDRSRREKLESETIGAVFSLQDLDSVHVSLRGAIHEMRKSTELDPLKHPREPLLQARWSLSIEYFDRLLAKCLERFLSGE
jgi:hypothetical protein